MIEIEIPGHKTLRLDHLVLDYNGTLACDGKLLPGIEARLKSLAGKLRIHVVTADTFGKASSELEGLPCELVILPIEAQDEEKLDYIRKLGAQSTTCIGNGRNDRLMLAEAALGLAVILEEGASTEALTAADVVCASVTSALDLLSNPLRLVATLRS